VFLALKASGAVYELDLNRLFLEYISGYKKTQFDELVVDEKSALLLHDSKEIM
jgi:hypothetical protein